MNVDSLRKSILQHAMQGRLVPQNPNDEPASELLKRIFAEKNKAEESAKKKKSQIESHIFRGDDGRYYEKLGKNTVDITEQIPFEIPQSWEWVRLGDACNIIMGQSPDSYNVRDVGNGVEFHQGKIFFGKKYLNKSNQITTHPTKIAEPDSILLCVRAPVGKINILQRKICIGRGL